MKIEIRDAGGDRGLLKGEWLDRYSVPCSIQTSSLAGEEPCIWLGQHRCDRCQAPSRAHLTREMAAALIPLLQHFVTHGVLPTSGPPEEG